MTNPHRAAQTALAAVAAAAVLTAGPALASTQTVSLGNQVNVNGKWTQQVFDNRTAALAGQVYQSGLSSSWSTTDLSASVNLGTRGAAGYGWLMADIWGNTALTTTQSGQSVLGYGTVSVTYVDDFVITCPTCVAGTTGFLSAPYWISPWQDGGGEANGGSTAWGRSFYASVAVNDAWGAYDNGEWIRSWGAANTSFIFGEPIHIEMTLSIEVFSSVTAALTGSTDAWSATRSDHGHFLRWGGISQVYGSDGTPLSGFSALSLDGRVNYALAAVPLVPEPGTWALMLGGLAVLAGVARRRSP